MRSQEQVLSTLGSASRGPWRCLSEFQANTSHRKAAAKCGILSRFHSWLTGWTTAHGLSCGHTSLTWCPERVPYGTYPWGMLGWMMKQGAQTLLGGPLLSSSESFSIFLPLKFSNSYFKVIFLWDEVYDPSNALPKGKLQKNNYSLWFTYHKCVPGTIL